MSRHLLSSIVKIRASLPYTGTTSYNITTILQNSRAFSTTMSKLVQPTASIISIGYNGNEGFLTFPSRRTAQETELTTKLLQENHEQVWMLPFKIILLKFCVNSNKIWRQNNVDGENG